MAHVTDQLNLALADRYLIERELGAGGMATVYLAKDLKHDRKVALKVLRSELAAVIGADRFLAEIKTTANLQHPHILPLHDSGEAGGLVFYVMPYVGGESLRDRLGRETQLPVDEAVRLTCEVASALDYAHRHGVIHRDIKPENILLHDGRALVADFGIALAVSRSDGGTRMTETGMSLGTPHYMSPEQAMGEREITAKSDVYALGCVLYEMLTGEPPFTGPTAQAIVARVMTEEPRSLTLQRRTIPPHVEAAVHTALAKLPADRFAGAAQFAAALQDPAFGGPGRRADGHELRAAGPPARRPAVVIVALAAIALAGGFVAGRVSAPASSGALVQFSIQAPDSVVGFGRCCGTPLALSPDGRTLVFVGLKGNGGPLYRRTIGRLEAEAISGTDGASVPFFSPDGRWLGFFVDGRILKVSMAGGPPIPIATTERVSEASWGEGDVIIFGGRLDGRALLFTVPASGGEPRALTSPDSLTAHYAPSFLPGGKAALLSMRERGGGIETVRIGVVDLASGAVDTIGLGTRAAYANGYLVYGGADNTLLAQPFDPDRRAVTGQAVAILDRIALHGNTTHAFTLSAAGGLAYQPGGGGANAGGEALRLSGPSGRSTITLPGRGGDNLEDPTFSPDGRRIALRLSSGTGTGTQDIWILDRQQGTLERLTVGGGWIPVWSPDGRRIAFARDAGIYVGPADGTTDPDLVLRGSALSPGSWLPDGRSLLFQASGRPNTLADIGLVTLGDTAPRWLIATEFRERHPQASPDGRWLAYGSDRTGQFEVYVQPLVGDGPRVQVSTEGGDSPRWSPDGRTLYYVVGAAVVAATRATGSGFEIATRKIAAEAGAIDLNGTNTNWDIHPNGREFLYVDQGNAEGARLVWILDWPELVRAMATGN